MSEPQLEFRIALPLDLAAMRRTGSAAFNPAD
jgi:hypothetical protein